MNRKIVVTIIVLLVSISSSFAQFGKLVDKAKSAVTGSPTGSANPAEIASALKQALELGATKSADLLSKENGFLHIPWFL